MDDEKTGFLNALLRSYLQKRSSSNRVVPWLVALFSMSCSFGPKKPEPAPIDPIAQAQEFDAYLFSEYTKNYSQSRDKETEKYLKTMVSKLILIAEDLKLKTVLMELVLEPKILLLKSSHEVFVFGRHQFIGVSTGFLKNCKFESELVFELSRGVVAWVHPEFLTEQEIDQKSIDILVTAGFDPRAAVSRLKRNKISKQAFERVRSLQSLVAKLPPLKDPILSGREFKNLSSRW